MAPAAATGHCDAAQCLKPAAAAAAACFQSTKVLRIYIIWITVCFSFDCGPSPGDVPLTRSNEFIWTDLVDNHMHYYTVQLDGFAVDGKKADVNPVGSKCKPAMSSCGSTPV
jgi:hypothetical protein